MENPPAPTGDHYKLKWNNHLPNFLQTFADHQHGEYLVDVTLSCGGQNVKAHKLILAACSDYFNTIFQIHANIHHPIIFLNGVQFVDLKYILDFMYSGEVKVLDKHLPEVLALGKTLQVKDFLGLSGVVIKNIPEDATAKETSVTACKPQKKALTKKPKLIKPAANIQPAPPKAKEPPEVPPLVIFDNGNTKAQQSETLNVPKVAPEPEVVPNILPQISPPISVTSASLPVITETFSLSPKLNGKGQSVLISNSNLPTILVQNPVISKPPHAFMIFASEWRKKLTIEHPDENPKQISVRLGNMWKTLLPETKNIYYREARRAEDEHKRKYAGLTEIRNESPKRKADVLSEPVNSNTTLNGNTPAIPLAVDHVEVVDTEEEHIAIIDSD